MKNIKIVILLLLLASNGFAQSLSHRVMATAGGRVTGGGVSLSYTIGETFTTKLFANNLQLTQGQQQPEIDLRVNMAQTTACAGATLLFPYTAAGYVDADNTFRVELSDAAGSFANPLVIGSATAMVSGTITATLPATAVGTAYIARVVSSHPARVSSDLVAVTINANYTITASAGIHGNSSSTGVTTLSCAGTAAKTYILTPDAGYVISNVLVDGTPNTALTTGSYATGGTYVFSNVNENHSIAVTFALACTNVGLASAAATASPICIDATTTLTYSGLSGSNVSVKWTANADGTGIVYGTGTPSIAVGPGTYYAYATGDCGSPVALAVTIASTPNVTPTFVQVSPVCSGATLSALPITSNNGITGTWSPALNNLETTEYTFKPTAGLCANNATMTIAVNPSVTPVFTQISSICSGATLSALPTTSNNGITGTWSPALNNLATTEYTFKPTPGLCANNATMTITVNPSLTPVFTQVSSICLGETLSALPTTSNNGISGSWSPIIDSSATTTYTFTPSVGQCSSNASMTITVNNTIAGTVSADQIIINGTQATNITLTNSAGAIQWQKSSDNINFTNVVGATSSVLTSTQIGALTSNRFFRAVVKSGNCAAVFSGVVSITLVTRTSVIEGQCGATLAALNTDIMAYFVQGATEYRFKAVAPDGSTEVIERGNRRYFNLTALTTISAAYNTSYTISVAVKKNGVWGDYGTECMVATPLAPITNVRSIQCGITLAALNTDVQADWLQFATSYRFKVVANGNTEMIDRSYRYFNLTALAAGAAYNTSYTISVAVKHNGIWGDFGAECIVTTPMAPTTKVRTSQCGATLTAFNTDILADWLQFAAAYRFKVVVNGASYIINPTGNRRYFKLTSLPVAVTANSTYTISVAAQFNGVWGNYGAECSVTTPGDAAGLAAPITKQITSIENADFSIVVYPNPSDNTFNLKINAANNELLSILVFDMTGRQIENKVVNATEIEKISLGQNYSAGVYNLIVAQGMQTKTVRLIKK